jgi:hypothetical protein
MLSQNNPGPKPNPKRALSESEESEEEDDEGEEDEEEYSTTGEEQDSDDDDVEENVQVDFEFFDLTPKDELHYRTLLGALLGPVLLSGKLATSTPGKKQAPVDWIGEMCAQLGTLDPKTGLPWIGSSVRLADEASAASPEDDSSSCPIALLSLLPLSFLPKDRSASLYSWLTGVGSSPSTVKSNTHQKTALSVPSNVVPSSVLVLKACTLLNAPAAMSVPLWQQALEEWAEYLDSLPTQTKSSFTVEEQ